MKFIQTLAGMGDLTEQVIAEDLLLNAKTAVRSYAAAISEAETAEVREVLRSQLDAALCTHEKILKLMIAKGWYECKSPILES